MGRARKGQRGQETRRRIVGAATRLFVEQGYLDTTMAAIAAEAGVAVQTLYLSYGSKGAILKAAHDVAIVGDDEPVPLLDRTWFAEFRAEPDGPRSVALLLANGLPIIERAAPIHGVIQAAAADPDVAALLQENEALRLATMQSYASVLATKAGFAPDLDEETTADFLYAILSRDLYRLLVLERHWPRDQLRDWLYQIVATRLFPGLQLPASALDRGGTR